MHVSYRKNLDALIISHNILLIFTSIWKLICTYQNYIFFKMSEVYLSSNRAKGTEHIDLNTAPTNHTLFLFLFIRYLANFIAELHRVFAHLHISYLEINPLVVCSDSQGHLRAHILDVAAKVDQCAEYLFSPSRDWSPDGEPITFPPSFGQTQTPEVRT